MRKLTKMPFLLFHLTSLFSLSTAVDILTPDRPLLDVETMISANGIFALGFFTLSNSSKKRYVGIWYDKISTQTVVWAANRNNPIAGSNASLSITSNGTLVVTDNNFTVMWSSSLTATTVSNPIAQIVDTGNFIVKDTDNGNSQFYAWQSFDYPTDTMLPGMKFGWNLTIGLNRKLTSWASPTDPSTSSCSLVKDISGDPQKFLWSGTTRTWRSGPWNGERFSGIPEMKTYSKLFTFNFVQNSEEVYYQFHLKDTTVISRLIVNKDGSLQRLVWLDQPKTWNLFWSAPKDQCDRVSPCGPFGVCNPNDSPICACVQGFVPQNQGNWDLRDGTDGCVRKTTLDCRNGTDRFMTITEAKLPDTSSSTMDMSLNLDQCMAKCLANCSCTAYASADINGTGCLIWTSNLTDLRVWSFGGQDLYVRLAAVDLDKVRCVLLDWQRRYSIIMGIARGLLYLPHDSRLRIIHRDLKASNILIDKEMDPKISDFGLARIFEENDTEVNSGKIVGTYGYISPEYAMDGTFSVKSDVYSFGVLVLEIVSGKKNRGVYLVKPDMNLLGREWSLWKEGKSLELVDESIGFSFPLAEATRCIRVALLCVQEHPEDRPTMSSVVLMLSSENAMLPEPKQPGFVTPRGHLENESSTCKQASSTVNKISITMLEGR